MPFVAEVKILDEISIGENVKIKVMHQVNVGRGCIRLLIDAPKEMEILFTGRARRPVVGRPLTARDGQVLP